MSAEAQPPRDILDELKEYAAKGTSVVAMPVEVLERAISTMEYLRATVGVVSQGPSFNEIREAVRGKPAA